MMMSPHNVSTYSDLDEMIVPDTPGLCHAVAPRPKERVVVPRFRVLTAAEAATPAAREAGDTETEVSACAEWRIARRHVPLEVLERSQIIRLRNLSVAAFVLALRAHRAACPDPAATRGLPPLPPVPTHHHLFDALPATEKGVLLAALQEQLLRLTYASDVRPDAETSWDAMQARCEAAAAAAAAAASASASASSSDGGAGGAGARPGSSESRRRSRADAGSSESSSLGASEAAKSPRVPGRRKTAPPPLKRVNRGDASRAVECPAEVREALATRVHRPGDPSRWVVVKLRPQMHPSTHRPRNVLYLHCAPAPRP